MITSSLKGKWQTTAHTFLFLFFFSSSFILFLFWKISFLLFFFFFVLFASTPSKIRNDPRKDHRFIHESSPNFLERRTIVGRVLSFAWIFFLPSSPFTLLLSFTHVGIRKVHRVHFWRFNAIYNATVFFFFFYEENFYSSKWSSFFPFFLFLPFFFLI